MSVVHSVTAKVLLDDNSKVARVVVRKVVLDDRQQVEAVYGLSQSGEWVKKPEGCCYPDECFLSFVVHEPVPEVDA
jgi:hypothetical protein